MLETTSDAEIIRLESLKRDIVEHSALLEVYNVPEFARILVCGMLHSFILNINSLMRSTNIEWMLLILFTSLFI